MKKQSASKSKKSASKGAAGGGAGKKSALPKGAKAAGVAAGTKAGDAARGGGATAPVVYQTLRERIDAVEANVGDTLPLSDFLKSSGWS